MSWVTVIWSMIASACLTLAVIYFLVWQKNRHAWAHLLFSVTAASTTVFAFCEMWMMRAQTPAQLLQLTAWGHVPLFFWLVSITWFVRIYLGAGRTWLAWVITVLRAFSMVANVLLGQNPDFRAVTNLQHVQFLGESVTILGGVPNPLTPITQFATVLVLVFVADASITAWRRGDRRKALMVGGSVEFFLIAALGTAAAIVWGNAQLPIVFSLFYLGLVAVMGSELSRDVLRASTLVHELQISEAGLRESEARMSLAVDAADFGIWTRDLVRHEIWASEKWRELFGFTSSEPLEFSTILQRLHPDDRDALQQAHAMAVTGSNDRRYQTEYRVVLPDGAIRWISSQGRVECDAASQPVLVRGASRDITARKHAELAIRDLSGRLLTAQEEERRRIARELHDNVSQQIALLALQIDLLAKNQDEPPAAMAQSMRELHEQVREISSDVHSLSHQLHSSKLEALGLLEALRAHCQELLARGLRTSFYDEHVPESLPHDLELCLFRIVQEALNNVVKHSGAREAHVTLCASGDVLVLSVSDSGEGFDPARASFQGGLGLASMRERLRLVNGELNVRSQPGQGTTIVARVPILKAGSKAASGSPRVA